LHENASGEIVNSTRIVSVNLSTGATLGIEVTELSVPDRDTEKAVSAFPIRFADVLAPIEALAHDIGELLQRVSPSQAAVEFGMEIGVEAGQLTALLVKGSGKANLKITLNWNASGPAIPPKVTGGTG
jgi:hypothetical protein